jgi:hypothetical protein
MVMDNGYCNGSWLSAFCSRLLLKIFWFWAPVVLPAKTERKEEHSAMQQ